MDQIIICNEKVVPRAEESLYADVTDCVLRSTKERRAMVTAAKDCCSLFGVPNVFEKGYLREKLEPGSELHTFQPHHQIMPLILFWP